MPLNDGYRCPCGHWVYPGQGHVCPTVPPYVPPSPAVHVDHAPAILAALERIAAALERLAPNGEPSTHGRGPDNDREAQP